MKYWLREMALEQLGCTIRSVKQGWPINPQDKSELAGLYRFLGIIGKKTSHNNLLSFSVLSL
jgi:hypothetical protein